MSEKNRGGRPEEYPIRKTMGFTARMLVEVDDWRATQRPMPTAADAIRMLIRAGLDAEAKRAAKRDGS